jgi:hypothetical protein
MELPRDVSISTGLSVIFYQTSRASDDKLYSGIQNLHSFAQCSWQVRLFVEDGNHQVKSDVNSELGLHRVGARAVVMFDPQAPVDPAEGQFNAPSRR